MKMKRKIAAVVAALMAFSILFTGCNQKKDTRQYIHTIGVVIQNDLDYVFDELYVYPAMNIENAEMGPDFIQNTRGVTKVGSYGVTVEEADAYMVWVRDENGSVYTFDTVAFENADFGVISFDDDLFMTVYHRTGGSETVPGEYVSPDDAPDQPYVPLKKRVAYDFTIDNKTNMDFRFISMREADNQNRGEVELFVDTLPAGKSTPISGKLFEEDEDITEWVLHVETTDDTQFTSTNVFDPWTTNTILITQEGDQVSLQIS